MPGLNMNWFDRRRGRRREVLSFTRSGTDGVFGLGSNTPFHSSRNGMCGQRVYIGTTNLLSSVFITGTGAYWNESSGAYWHEDIAAPTGFSWAKRINQTANSANNVMCYQNIACSASTAYTMSVWIRLVSGTVSASTVQLIMRSQDEGTSTSVNCSVTSEWQRFTLTKTTTSSATSLTRTSVIANWATSAYVIDVADWQLEAKAYATDFTTSARLTEQITFPIWRNTVGSEVPDNLVPSTLDAAFSADAGSGLAAGWDKYGTAVGVTGSIVTPTYTHPLGGSVCQRVVVASGYANSGIYTPAGYRAPVTPDAYYSVGAYIAVTALGSGNSITMLMSYYDSGGTLIGGGQSTAVSAADSAFTWREISSVAPAGAATVRVVLISGSVTTGATFEIACMGIRRCTSTDTAAYYVPSHKKILLRSDRGCISLRLYCDATNRRTGDGVTRVWRIRNPNAGTILSLVHLTTAYWQIQAGATTANAADSLTPNGWHTFTVTWTTTTCTLYIDGVQQATLTPPTISRATEANGWFLTPPEGAGWPSAYWSGIAVRTDCPTSTQISTWAANRAGGLGMPPCDGNTTVYRMLAQRLGGGGPAI